MMGLRAIVFITTLTALVSAGLFSAGLAAMGNELMGEIPARAGKEEVDKSLDKLLNRPAQRHAFVFSWGAVFGNLNQELAQRGKILHVKPGDRIIKDAGGVRYEYSFFRKSRVREMVAKRVREKGKERMVLERLILEPAEPARAARLFAVMVHFPVPMPFEGEHKQRLMESLNAIYGKAVNVHRHYFDMENTTTQVRVYLRRHRGKAYVLRLVFNSRGLAAQRNEHILSLRRQATGQSVSGPPIRKTVPVMTSASPRTNRTEFIPGDKVLADTSRSRRIKTKESAADGSKIRLNKTRLVVDAERKKTDSKTDSVERRP